MDKTPATVQIDAPASLSAAFVPAGYAVTIVVTRTGKASLPNDPDALAPLADAPFSDQEKRNLAGMIAAYEAKYGKA